MTGLDEFIARSYESRKVLLGRWPGGLPEGLNAIEARCYRYIAATLPATDLGDYSPEMLARFARHGAKVRREWPWCAVLPEELFLPYVLCPRVNNEELSDCRGLFFGQLAPRVRGLSLPEAILEVNRWCAEQVTYRSTDERTASALAVYQCGYGRCGEESVFAVNALRSVGIAARQVYAPWWSHCDDNHAWVEAFDGERWRFLGACEPEPRLDMGWFIPAAGRAMLCHAKCFVGDGDGWETLFPGTDPLDRDRREGVAYINVTQRYAKARAFTTQVRDGSGNALPGAVVDYYVLNEGLLRKIAQRVTDTEGKAALNLGLGSVWVTARQGGTAAEMLADTARTDCVTLDLPGSFVEPGNFDFAPPADGGMKAVTLSEEEKSRRREVQEHARELWETRHAGGPPLPEKPPEPWTLSLPGAAPEVTLEKLWPWLEEHIGRLDSFSELFQTPAGALRLGAAHKEGLAALFCGICRGRGVEARPGPDGVPEFWQKGRFHRVDGLGSGRLSLRRGEGKGALGLMRWQPGWRRVPAPEFGQETELPEGKYRLITSTRLPNGTQLAGFTDFTLAPGEYRELTANFRKGSPQELLQNIPLPEMGFGWEGLALLCWIEPGAEPTEHLLGELRDAGKLSCQVHFIGDGLDKLSYLPEDARLHGWDGYMEETVARRMFLEPGNLPLVVLADGQGSGRFASAGYRVGSVELINQLCAEIAIVNAFENR